MSEQQLQRHGREKPARTSIPAGTEVQVARVQVGKFVFVALGRICTHVEIPQPVKDVRIWRHVRIEHDVPGCGAEMCARGKYQSGREGELRLNNSMKGHWND